MEETNYSRHVIVGHEAEPEASATSPTDDLDEKKAPMHTDAESADSSIPPKQSQKTYAQKLKLFQPADIHKPSQLLGMVTRPLIFLTFPVILYAGFSYGSNLVWFNGKIPTYSPF